MEESSQGLVNTLRLPLPDLYCDTGIGRHDELAAMIILQKATAFQSDLPERCPTTCATPCLTLPHLSLFHDALLSLTNRT